MSIDKPKYLLHASEHGQLKKVQSILLSANLVDCCDDHSHRPLHYAASNGHEQVVRYLLKKAATLDSKNWCGWTPLMFAAYYGHINIVKILAQSKANVNALNDSLASPLICAARCGHENVVETLLEHGSAVNNPGTNHTLTPLMTASQHGHARVVSLLLQYGAAVDYQNPVTKYTALMLASMNGYLNVVQLLVEKGGANVNLTNTLGMTALMLSATRERYNVEHYLADRTNYKPTLEFIQNKKPEIIDATERQSLNEIRNILRKDKKCVNDVDELGGTPLIYAAMHGNSDIVELLLEYGANVNIQDKVHGWTALMQATLNKHTTVVRLLLQKDETDVNLKARNGVAAFDLATVVGNAELIRMMAFAMQRSNDIAAGLIPTEKEDKGSMKVWFTKKMGFKSGRNMQTIDRLPVGKEQIMGLSPTTIGEEEHGLLHKTSSVQSVLDAAKLQSKGRLERSRLNLVAPHVELPDDVVAPVLPPYSKLPSFDLPTMPVGSKLSSSGGSEVSPQSSSGESQGLGSLWHQPGRKMKRAQMNSNGIMAPHEKPDSPQSSLTSSSSYFTSVSRNKGPGAMPSVSKFHRPTENISILSEYPSNSYWAKRNANKPSPSPSTVSNVTPLGDMILSKQPSKLKSQSSLPTLRREGSSVISAEQGLNSSVVKEEDPEENDVGKFLQKLSLIKYKSTFEDEQVDMEALLVMDDSDLKQIGIDQTINRRKILSAVAQKGSNEARSSYDAYSHAASSGFAIPSSNYSRSLSPDAGYSISGNSQDKVSLGNFSHR